MGTGEFMFTVFDQFLRSDPRAIHSWEMSFRALPGRTPETVVVGVRLRTERLTGAIIL
jgi:hypothetical protein